MKYPLHENAFSLEDINKGIEVLRSKQITMGRKTLEFEKYFANRLGVKHALMVNSGSSANLLATFAAGNLLRKNKFKIGDEAILPVLCWSTSLWPLVQAGLKPVFVDVLKLNILPVKLFDVTTEYNAAISNKSGSETFIEGNSSTTGFLKSSNIFFDNNLLA